MVTKHPLPRSKKSSLRRVLVHVPGERPSTRGIHLIPHNLDHSVELCTCYLARQHGLEHYRLKRGRSSAIKGQRTIAPQRKKPARG